MGTALNWAEFKADAAHQHGYALIAQVVELAKRAKLSPRILWDIVGIYPTRFQRITTPMRIKLYEERFEWVIEKLTEGLDRGELPCDFEKRGLAAFLKLT